MNTDLDEGPAYDVTPPMPPPSRLALQAATPGSPLPLGYHAPNSRAAKTDTQTITHVYAPLWLLGGGVAIQLAGAFLTAHDLESALIYVAVVLFLGTAVMLAGMLLAARARGIDLGPFGPAVLKLAAVSVAPAAVVSILSLALRFIPVLGSIAGLLVEFVLYFAMLGALFELEESDTWYCVCVIFLVRLGVYFFVMFAL